MPLLHRAPHGPAEAAPPWHCLGLCGMRRACAPRRASPQRQHTAAAASRSATASAPSGTRARSASCWSPPRRRPIATRSRPPHPANAAGPCYSRLIVPQGPASPSGAELPSPPSRVSCPAVGCWSSAWPHSPRQAADPGPRRLAPSGSPVSATSAAPPGCRPPRCAPPRQPLRRALCPSQHPTVSCDRPSPCMRRPPRGTPPCSRGAAQCGRRALHQPRSFRRRAAGTSALNRGAPCASPPLAMTSPSPPAGSANRRGRGDSATDPQGP
mmetsp:Transcript_86347/g.249358  ORF Transcript_86347/g.249358 Transcript_86347/m.249358 type:complete len:269 (+) Transcript_86347:1023-1829(+)